MTLVASVSPPTSDMGIILIISAMAFLPRVVIDMAVEQRRLDVLRCNDLVSGLQGTKKDVCRRNSSRQRGFDMRYIQDPWLKYFEMVLGDPSSS